MLSQRPSTDYLYLGIIIVIVAVARGIYTIIGPLLYPNTLASALRKLI